MKIRVKNNIDQTVEVFDTADGDFTLMEPARMEIMAAHLTTVELFHSDLIDLSGADRSKNLVVGYEQEERVGILDDNGLGMVFYKDKMLTIIVDEGPELDSEPSEEDDEV